jgi:hypothetical protein
MTRTENAIAIINRLDIDRLDVLRLCIDENLTDAEAVSFYDADQAVLDVLGALYAARVAGGGDTPIILAAIQAAIDEKESSI